MAFVWKGFGLAHDFQNGITIKLVNRFEDLGPGDALPYSYSQGDLVFEFRATAYSDWRMFTSFVNTELRTMHTATYIIENSIKFGLTMAHRQSISLGEYQDLKRTIRDGMLALTTQGGYLFRFIPDFQLEFVDTEKDVPKRPPRPSDPGTAITASLSEKPLTLGDKKNIGFVYEDYGARDAEKGITITRIHKFEDISFDDPMPYIYSYGDLVFEFRASIYRDWRLPPDMSTEKPLRPHTATYVIEESIKQGMMRAKCRPLAAEEYHVLRQNIKDGMWVAETRDGRSLRDIPDFRLEFVDAAKDVPRWPPRPST